MNFIDVHHHIVPPFYLEEARTALIAQGSLSPKLEAWTPDAALEAMQSVGIGTAMISVSAPGIWFGDARISRSLARRCNEYAAGLAARHPGRFGSFAALPLPDVAGSLEEIRHVFDVLNADGICLMTSYGDKWPGDPVYAPVFEELNRRKAVVFFHPTVPCACQAMMPGISPSMIEFPFDTVRAIVSLLFNGTLARYRGIRFIFSHAGGALSSLAGRIEALSQARGNIASHAPDGVARELARLHYDLAIASNQAAVDSLLQWAPASQLLLGTDFPFRPIEEGPQGIAQLSLAEPELAAIRRGNALALFPRLNY